MKKKIVAVLYILAFTLVSGLTAHSQKRFTLTVQIDDAAVDSVTLSVHPLFIASNQGFILPPLTWSARPDNGRFRFRTGLLKDDFYFVIRTWIKGQSKTIPRTAEYLSDYMIGRPGDSVELKMIGGKSQFTGRGNDKYNYQAHEIEAYQSQVKRYGVPRDLNPDRYMNNIKEQIKKRFDMLKEQLDSLVKWKNKVEPDLYNVFRANIIGRIGTFIIYPGKIGDQTFKKLYNGEDSVRNMAQIREWVSEAMQREPFNELQLTTGIVPKDYVTFLYNRLLMTEESERSDSAAAKVLSVEGAYSNEIISYYILIHFRHFNTPRSILATAIQKIKSPAIKNMIRGILDGMTQNVYTDVTAWDVHGKKRKLSDYRGKVMLVDFWFTGCEGCVGFYKNHLKPLEEMLIDSTDYVFVSICNDLDKLKWQRSIASGLYTSPKVVNLFTKGFDHPLNKQFKVSGHPTYAIVDPLGNIKMLSSRRLPAEVLAAYMRKLRQ